LLTHKEQNLREFYRILLNLSQDSVFANGEFSPLNIGNTRSIKSLFAFSRFHEKQAYIVINQFDTSEAKLDVSISKELIAKWQLTDGSYGLVDMFSGKTNTLIIKGGKGLIELNIESLGSLVYKVSKNNE